MRSPSLKSSFAASTPIFTTVPAGSCEPVMGNDPPNTPSATIVSVWQCPAQAVLMRISQDPTSGTGISRTTYGLRARRVSSFVDVQAVWGSGAHPRFSRICAARMVFGIGVDMLMSGVEWKSKSEGEEIGRAHV